MAATPVVVVLVVTLVSGPGGRPAVAVDSPLDLQQFEGAALVAYQVAFAVSITVFLMSAASLLMRFRRARGVERQQLRWVAFATVVVSLLSLANLAALALGAYAWLRSSEVSTRRSCRQRSARRSCATGCTTWTASSAARSPTGC
jgi:sterol desaturase/sphingolipid hydroxylase (fatty acid hydroxylase superfamily)